MRRQLPQQIQTQALPHLRQKLAQEFESEWHQHHQIKEKKRNLIIEMLIAGKNWIQNAVAFIFTLVFIIPLWIFKIVLKCFDLIQRAVRFVLWLYVKVIVLMINFVFKLLKFFHITAAANFFKKTVKQYLGNYSTDNELGVETLSGLELIMNKKQHNLIDVKKVQKKIKTPNIFLSHQGSNRNIISSQREDYVERINRDLVPQRIVHQNIVETSHRLKTPHLLALSQSHSRLKRTSTEPNLLSSATPRLQIQVPLDRQNTSPVKKMEPDRDISPDRYNKNPLVFSQSSFKKKQTPEKQILMLHHHPIIHGTKTQKEILEQQLLTLRTKMQELIEQNNSDIHELQSWIQQKSQTITMTRKQNIELLNKIQQLQKENIRKNQKFTQLQEKIKDMESTLEKQKHLRNGLNTEIQKLQEQIKTKTIEIMSLKEKIKKNFLHLQQMENIFGNERFDPQIALEKQYPLIEKVEEAPASLEQSHHSLKKDLNEIQVQDISNRYQPARVLQEQKNFSLIKEIDEVPNPKDIVEVDIKIQHRTESEIQASQKLIAEQDIQAKSIKSTPPQIQSEVIPVQQKIKLEQQNTLKLVEQVEEFLIQQQEKLQSFIKEPLPLKKLIETQLKVGLPQIQKKSEIKIQNQEEKPQEKSEYNLINQQQQNDEKEEQQNKATSADNAGTKNKKKNKKKKR